MNEDDLKEMLKNLFKNEELKITVDVSKDYDGHYISTQVICDNEIVYENEERFYLSI